MNYLFENLDPERFQQFCQSLLSSEFPKIQCFPVGQPDGGRDAIGYYVSENANDFIVFQVKFVRRPQASEDPHRWLVEILKEEAPKIQKLIPKGAREYYLLTNVPGTAHLDSGSIDKVQNILNDTLPIPSYCWWRDDLNSKLDSNWDLKWAYPEVMTGVDMLRYVIESRLLEKSEYRTAAIRAFVRDQYENDKEVRFKQVELQNLLLDLFIDVPVVFRRNHHDKRQFLLHRNILHRLSNLSSEEVQPAVQKSFFDDEDRYIGAATLLLHPYIYEHYSQIVLEGAPGQGKSTIVQYVCQVHRMRVLGEEEIIQLIPENHKSTALRIPFKVDLRDLAAWLNKQDPFSPENTDEPPVGWHKSLAAFLAAQVRHHSGGFDFSVADLHAIAKVSALLLVLDGFDEVADIPTRQEIIKEVKRGINNLRESAISLQVVITSRPAAFANSPGFPEEEFPHLELASITRGLITEYAEKWIKAKRLQGRLGAEIRRTLKEKLDQPHLRDLARNPMQLAILLSLIHTRGSSLPEKRTALYDNYVELFFNREAEKNEVVREYRDLLIDIHRYLAWILHSEAEIGNDRGSISEERLHQLLVNYLKSEGRASEIAQKLFTGMIERVVALVSRVQGTYEFEVQTLREYFAARHLFETAPYSPPGAEKRGTRPDRFDGIARNFYWLNVTRFYAGCYSKGELPSLVDRLIELAQEEGYRSINHPRILAAILLSDWVFAQHQKSVKEVISIILDGLGLRYLLRGGLPHRSISNALVLPKDSGRDELIQRCFEILSSYPAQDYVRELIELIKANSIAKEIINTWYKQALDIDENKRTKWIEYGLYLGLLPLLEDNQLEQLIADDPDQGESLGFIFRARKLEFCESSEERITTITQAILARKITVHPQWHVSSIIGWFAQVFEPHRYIIAFDTPQPIPLSEVRNKGSYRYPPLEDRFEPSPELFSRTPIYNNTLDKCLKLIKTAQEESNQSARAWATELTPWDNVLEKSRSLFGERWVHFHLANISSGIKSHSETCTDFPNLFDHSKSLCRRTRYARLRAGQPNWWKSQFEMAGSTFDVMFALLVLLTWASLKTLIEMSNVISDILDSLPDNNWHQLASSLEQATAIAYRETSRRFDTRKLPDNLSVRTVVAIAMRLNDQSTIGLYEEYLKDYQGNDPVVLEYCQKSAIEQLLKGQVATWEHNQTILEKSYALGVVSNPYDIHWLLRNEHNNLSLNIAKHITEHADRYPSFLVTISEAKCREEVASKMVPVAEIAKKEGWFSI